MKILNIVIVATFSFTVCAVECNDTNLERSAPSSSSSISLASVSSMDSLNSVYDDERYSEVISEAGNLIISLVLANVRSAFSDKKMTAFQSSH